MEGWSKQTNGRQQIKNHNETGSIWSWTRKSNEKFHLPLRKFLINKEKVHVNQKALKKHISSNKLILNIYIIYNLNNQNPTNFQQHQWQSQDISISSVITLEV